MGGGYKRPYPPTARHPRGIAGALIARSVNGQGAITRMDVTNNTKAAGETLLAEEGYQYADLAYADE